MSKKKEDIVKDYALEPLEPEGGYYKKIFESNVNKHSGSASAIYYLIDKDSFSSCHRLTCEELWVFIKGDAYIHVQEDGENRKKKIINKDKFVVPANSWQSTKLLKGGEYALFLVVVTPQYSESSIEFRDMDLFK